MTVARDMLPAAAPVAPTSSRLLTRGKDTAMQTTPVYWQCPRCGLADGWDVPPALRRVWVEASCPTCGCDYRVLVTQPVGAAPQCQVVHADLRVVHIACSSH